MAGGVARGHMWFALLLPPGSTGLQRGHDVFTLSLGTSHSPLSLLSMTAPAPWWPLRKRRRRSSRLSHFLWRSPGDTSESWRKAHPEAQTLTTGFAPRRPVAVTWFLSAPSGRCPVHHTIPVVALGWLSFFLSPLAQSGTKTLALRVPRSLGA